MGIPIWKSALFFLVVSILGISLIPSDREIGRFHADNNDSEEALQYLELRYDKNPYDINNTHRYLLSLLNNGEYPKLENVSKEITRKLQDSYLINSLIARYHYERWQLDEASIYWFNMLQSNDLESQKQEDVEEIRSQLISYYRLIGDYNRLIDLYEYELKQKDNLTTYYALAKIYSIKKDAENAIFIYSKITRLYPQETNARKYLGTIYEHFEEKEQALEIYQGLAEDFPMTKEFDILLGEKLLQFDKDEEFKNFITFFKSKYPKDHTFRENEIGLMSTAKYEEKIAMANILEESYKNNPNNSLLLLELGAIYNSTKQYQKAYDKLQEYISQTGGSSRAYHILGDVLFQLGVYHASQGSYRKALEFLEFKQEQ